jgi:hypothetical protein
MTATADKRGTMPTLIVTDADGNQLEAKIVGASKSFDYRDEADNKIKRARQEKSKPAVIAPVTATATAPLASEPATYAIIAEVETPAPATKPADNATSAIIVEADATPVAVELTTERAEPADEKKAVANPDTLAAPEPPYTVSLTESDQQRVYQYFHRLLTWVRVSPHVAHDAATDKMQRVLSLEFFTTEQRATFVAAVDKDMSEGVSRQTAETTALFALLFPTPTTGRETESAESPLRATIAPEPAATIAPALNAAPYITSLTDAECKDMTEYFYALAIEGGASTDAARTKASQDLQDCFNLAHFTDTERAAFVAAVAKDMAAGATRHDAETNAFFNLPLPPAVWEPTPAPVPKHAATIAPAPVPPPVPKAAPQSRQGRDALRYFTEHGIKLIGRYESNAAIASGDDYSAAFTDDFAVIEALIAGKGDRQGRAIGQRIKRFAFIPADYGFLCLDIDRKPADIAADPKHGDGLRNFYHWLDGIGKPRDMRPLELRNIEGGSFPCYVTTPSGGYHLYFRYKGAPIQQAVLCDEVEIKHGRKNLTAAGSFKDGKPYVLYGNLSDAPPLPKFILDYLLKPSPVTLTPHFAPLGKEKFQGATSWDKVIEFTDTDGKGTGGYAEWAYSAARHAATHNWNQSDTLEALRCEPRIEGLEKARIISAVESAYKEKL